MSSLVGYRRRVQVRPLEDQESLRRGQTTYQHVSDLVACRVSVAVTEQQLTIHGFIGDATDGDLALNRIS